MAGSDASLQNRYQQELANPTSILHKVRATLEKRYKSSAIKNVGRMFKIFDDDGSRKLDKEEFQKGMLERGVQREDIDEVFAIFDMDGSGTVDYNEFLLALRGPMPKCRLNLIQLAFDKLDKTGDGVITIQDLKNVFECKHNPKFQSGEWTEEQCLRKFLDTFDANDHKDGKVTKDEFINYYCGVSSNIDDDSYFDLMMRNSWKL